MTGLTLGVICEAPLDSGRMITSFDFIIRPDPKGASQFNDEVKWRNHSPWAQGCFTELWSTLGLRANDYVTWLHHSLCAEGCFTNNACASRSLASKQTKNKQTNKQKTHEWLILISLKIALMTLSKSHDINIMRLVVGSTKQIPWYFAANVSTLISWHRVTDSVPTMAAENKSQFMQNINTITSMIVGHNFSSVVIFITSTLRQLNIMTLPYNLGGRWPGPLQWKNHEFSFQMRCMRESYMNCPCVSANIFAVNTPRC